MWLGGRGSPATPPSPHTLLASPTMKDALEPRKVDARLPEKGNSNSHSARPVNLIITMIKWIRTSRLSIDTPLSLSRRAPMLYNTDRDGIWYSSQFGTVLNLRRKASYSSQFEKNHFTEMCSGSEAGWYLRPTDFCTTQLYA